MSQPSFETTRAADAAASDTATAAVPGAVVEPSDQAIDAGTDAVADAPTDGAAAPTGRPSDDLAILDFDAYDVIIDARSPREYEDDHLPGAINLPVVGNEEFAVVGILHKSDRHRAYLRGVADSLRNMAEAIDHTLSRQPAHARVLVYCFRGGKRSRLWADTLQTIGFRTDRLAGGWKRYRRWVIACLETLPRQFRYRVLNGPTGSGKTRLLQALEAIGEQVLDLEGLARHRGSLIGAIPGVPQPGQKLFESAVLDRLRHFDPQRPVWVEAESKKIGAVQLPTALFESLHASRHVHSLSLPMTERVRIWHEDFGHFAADPQAMLARLQHLIPLVGHDEFDAWKALAGESRIDQLFERIMANHYDPAYERTARRNYRRQPMIPLALPDLAPSTLADVARRLAAEARDG